MRWSRRLRISSAADAALARSQPRRRFVVDAARRARKVSCAAMTTTIDLTAEQARWFRFRAGGLAAPFESVELACAALAGVQAQIVPAAGLALWNRTRGFTQRDLERRLYEDRSLVKLWGQRHTLHLYPSREWPLVHAAVSSRETWWERQIRANGGDVEAHRATVRRIAALLRKRGTLGRDDLRAAGFDLAPEMLSSWGGVFAELVRRGHAVHARPEGSEGRFAARSHWLPDLAWSPPEGLEANAELARRYLRAYGPASVRDFAYWRGARIADAAAAIAKLGREARVVRLDGEELLAHEDDVDALEAKPPSADEWPVKMLYRFDVYLLAHREKSWVVPSVHRARVWRPAGHIEGVVLVRGAAVATWRYERDERAVRIDVAPFGRVAKGVHREIERCAGGVAEYFGAPLGDVRFG